VSADHHFIFDILSLKADLILQAGTPGLEYERSDMNARIRFVGALQPYARQGVEGNNWYDNRLRRFDKTVLVTQGTVEKDVEKLLVPVLEAMKNSDTLVICTTGGSKTKELRARFPQENLIIEDFIPFAEVMPYCDAYITNGGYGGVMQGVCNKLPLLVAGVDEGKNEICARIGYFKYGINLKTQNPTAEQVRKGLNQLLSDSSYRENINRLSREFENYDTLKLCSGYIAQVAGRVRPSATISSFTRTKVA